MSDESKTEAEQGQSWPPRTLSFRFWFWWARVCQWWEMDVWGWLVDVPCSPPEGQSHCIGRRTKKPVYCPDCDGGEQ